MDLRVQLVDRMGAPNERVPFVKLGPGVRVSDGCVPRSCSGALARGEGGESGAHRQASWAVRESIWGNRQNEARRRRLGVGVVNQHRGAIGRFRVQYR